ncbi:hypothetical protein V2E39_23445, partial [Chryseobacterium arthrosphaerae]
SVQKELTMETHVSMVYGLQLVNKLFTLKKTTGTVCSQSILFFIIIIFPILPPDTEDIPQSISRTP